MPLGAYLGGLVGRRESVATEGNGMVPQSGPFGCLRFHTLPSYLGRALGRHVGAASSQCVMHLGIGHGIVPHWMGMAAGSASDPQTMNVGRSGASST